MLKLKILLYVVGSTLLASGAFANQLDINSANAVSLAEHIQGVGPKLAKAIVEYREENGPFLSIEALINVKGLGPAILERNLDILRIQEVGEKEEGVEVPN